MNPEVCSVLTEDGWQLQLLRFAPSTRTVAWPVLCVHGFSQNHRSWTEGGFVRALGAAGCEVYVLDFRGHGGSVLDSAGRSRGGFDWDVDDYLFRDLRAAVGFVQEQQEGRPLILCGHSLGGLCAAIYTYLYPKDVALFAMLAAPLEISKAAIRVQLASQWMLLAAGVSQKARLPWKSLPGHLLFSGMEKVFFGLPGAGSLLPWLSRHDRRQAIPRLWNSLSTEAETVRALLTSMEAEPLSVVTRIADWAVRGGLRLGSQPEIDYLPLLSSITTPHLGAWGDEDLLAPPRTADSFYEKLGNVPHKRMLLRQTNHIDITAGTPALEVARELISSIEQWLVPGIWEE